MFAVRAHRSLVAVLVLCAVTLLAVGAGRARAGTWTLVSCSQPDGQPAPTDGWAAAWWAGGATSGSGDTNTCAAPGGGLVATSSQNGAAGSYTGPEWVFTAPGGSTIEGGSITASLTSPQGQAWIGTPSPAYDTADVVVNCQQGTACGSGGTLSGTFPIGHVGGTSIYAPAVCVPASSAPAPLTCPATGGTGVNAQVTITGAEIELAVDATPRATGFAGSLLSRGASGTAELTFTASDPAVGGGFGPGVAGVTVQIDGKTVYSGIPDTNDGACASLGTDPATGGPMFDRAQPCAGLAKLKIPVPTAGLSDGRHQLTVVMSDATGETATVLTRSITTSNPVTSPAPRRPFEVAARLSIGWTFKGGRSQLDSAHAVDLPARGTISAACTGRRCPKLTVRRVQISHIAKLWTELKHATLHAGDQLELTIRAPHRHPEPIEFRIRSGRAPTARLVDSR